jgi:AcrR family transcriptional regulator
MERTEIQDRILESATKMFMRFGYSKVKTAELANDVGISKRTLYENFHSKESILQEIVDGNIGKKKDEIENIIARMKIAEDDDYLIELKKLLCFDSDSANFFNIDFMSDIRKSAPKVFETVRGFRKKYEAEYFETIFTIGKEKEFFRADLNMELVYILHTLIEEKALNDEITSKLPFTAKEVFLQFHDLLLCGSLTKKGQEDFKRLKESC